MAKENKILYIRKTTGKYNRKDLENARVRESRNASQIDDAVCDDDYTGIIASGVVASVADVLLPDNSRVVASIPKKAPVIPVIGDRVLLDKNNNIVRVLPRVSRLARMRTIRGRDGATEQVFAANVDIAVIVATAAEPVFSSEFVDRYLALAEYGNVTPIIVLNKSDLTSVRDPILVWYRKLGIRVIETSAITLRGIDELRDAISGNTVVFVGKSGAGKSSLINALYPDADIKTNSFSVKANQGLHTTVISNLYNLDDNTRLIDTPGVRKLDVSGIPRADLGHYFIDIKKYAHLCKYADCVHDTCDGCAVIAAVDSGKIPRARYENYLNMLS